MRPDADGDNYPVQETRTFNCELILGSLAATLVLMDKDDADSASGVAGKVNSAYVLGVDTPAFSITTDVSLDVSRSDGAADYGVVSRGMAGIVTPFSRTDYDGTYDATLTGTFMAGTFGLNQGGFTFAITPADCETVDAALQEECRQAVQEAGSGISLGIPGRHFGTHVRHDRLRHRVHRRLLRSAGRRRRRQVHLRRLRTGDRHPTTGSRCRRPRCRVSTPNRARHRRTRH